MKEFLRLLSAGGVASRASCRWGGGIQNSGGPAMKINTQIPLVFLLTTLIPLVTTGSLSYFNAMLHLYAKDELNLRGQPGNKRSALK